MSIAAVHPRGRNALTPGLGLMTRLVWRRNAIRLAVWVMAIVGLTILTSDFYSTQFHSAETLAERAQLSRSAGMRTVFGTVTSSGLGAAVWSEMWMFTAVVWSIVLALVVTRDNRADEEAGRTELLLSRSVSAGAELAASVIVSTVASIVAGFGTALATAAFGLDRAGHEGSWIMGASLSGVGLIGIGVAALTNQLATTGHGANMLALGVIGVFYLVRAIGDLSGSPLVWLSPIGWGEKADPWGANRWWALGLIVVAFALCVTVASRLRARRDYGAGVTHSRPGPVRARTAETTEFGLVARVGLGTAVAWVFGMAAWALLLGSTFSDMRSISGEFAVLSGGGGLNGVIALWIRLTALVVAGFVARELLTLREDEERGRLEARLAGSVSRWRVVGTRLLYAGLATVVMVSLAGAIMGVIYGAGVSDLAWTGRLTVAALAQLPSLGVVAGLTVLGLGWFPRLSRELAWGVVGVAWVIALFGSVLRIPARVLDRLPFAGVALPAVAPSLAFMVVVSLVALALLGLGVVGYRRRDIPR